MTAGTSRARRWTTRIVLSGLFGAAVVGLVAAVTYATGAWGPLSDGVQADVGQAIVGYELAKDPIRISGTAGRDLTRSDRAALQERFLRRLERYATGPALADGRAYDYVTVFKDSERRGRRIVGATGWIAYWDGPRKDMDGEVHVRAGVGHRYEVILWDEDKDRAVPQQDWVPSVVVYDYSLRQVDGVWKVADSAHWRFFDPATGQLGTGP